MCRILLPGLIILLLSNFTIAQKQALEALDVFGLTYVSDPEFSPAGDRLVFSKHGFDIMTDRRTSDLWLCDANGAGMIPLAATDASEGGAAWSPEGDRIAWVASLENEHQLVVRWLDQGEQHVLARFQKPPGDLVWSPDGQWIAFTLFVPAKAARLFEMPDKPEGAEWAEPPTFTQELVYRADGRGQLPIGTVGLYILPANGGGSIQLPTGDFDVRGPLSWSADSEYIYFAGNADEITKYDFAESDLYRIGITDSKAEQLTDRKGVESSPVVSPDGAKIAWVGFENNYKAHQQTEVYVSAIGEEMNARLLTGGLDRTLEQLQWSPEGDHLWFAYTDRGKTAVGRVGMDGEVEKVTEGLCGNPLGRPYTGGTYALGSNGRLAISQGSAVHPPELAVGHVGSGALRQVTQFNKALLLQKQPAEVEPIWFKSSYDQRDIQGWIVYPPDFDESKKYPLLLEIHGGPHLAYGDCFSMELQLFAAAGYVVLYTNPRGSTGYGEEFANLIHHNYPGEDYDDLMTAVDGVIERGFIDEDRLYVTGGSGGGILTAWIVGKTDRFRAAVSAKPVINWVSELLSSDIPDVAHYWFGVMPWEDIDAYWNRSPLSLVDQVSTPTMLLVGDQDYRTPLSESEQFYRALKLEGVETALVRFPDSPHGIAGRPSRMIAKVRAIMGWFER